MDKLNRLMIDPNFDCRLVIQPNFVGLLKATLYVKSLTNQYKEYSVAVEDTTLTNVLAHLDSIIDD